MKIKEHSLQTLYQYRYIWMGIAILWIVLFHLRFSISSPLLKFIKEIGYGGVDIFLFASGLGMYFSYTRDHNPVQFMKRRLLRIVPVYVPFIIVWLICMYFLRPNYPLQSIIGNFFGLQGFTSPAAYSFNWYITCLWIVYLLTPIFSNIIENIKKPSQFFLFLALLVVISTAFWGDDDKMHYVTRIPSFVIGMYFAKMATEGKSLTGKLKGILAGGMVVGTALLIVFFTFCKDYLETYGLNWYPFILITPGICLLISSIVHKIRTNTIGQKLCNLVTKIGEYSFEIYLVHILFIDLQVEIIRRNLTMVSQMNWLTLSILLLIIPCSVLLRMCAKGCRKWIQHFEKN